MKPSNLLVLGLGLVFVSNLNLSAQPVPHQFSGITVAPDKTFTLTLDGSVAGLFNLTGTISNQFRQMLDLYVVEASINLADWTRLALLPRSNNDPNPLLFQDTNAAGLSQRFYRTFTDHLLTAFPQPSGPFAVGTVDRVMIDPARTNPYRYSPPTNAFMVSFWYPADPPPAGVLQKPFLLALRESNYFYSEAQWLFSKATSNAVFLQIRGADHQTASDAAWSIELPKGPGLAAAINACLLWFFDTYLKGEAPPFPTNPEIYNVQRK